MEIWKSSGAVLRAADQLTVIGGMILDDVKAGNMTNELAV